LNCNSFRKLAVEIKWNYKVTACTRKGTNRWLYLPLPRERAILGRVGAQIA